MTNLQFFFFYLFKIRYFVYKKYVYRDPYGDQVNDTFVLGEYPRPELEPESNGKS